MKTPYSLIAGLIVIVLATAYIEGLENVIEPQAAELSTCWNHVDLLETGYMKRAEMEWNNDNIDFVHLTYLTGTAKERQQKVYTCRYVNGILVDVYSK